MQITFQEVVGGAQKLLVCTYVRALMISHKIQCVKFHCAKNSQKKFSSTACIGEIGENFLLAKISTYTVLQFVYM